jgi:hypothetical protein
MAKVSRADQEFLGEMIDSLGVSLDRVELNELKEDSDEAKHWQLAQSWLEDARRVKKQAPSQAEESDVYRTLPPFPLTGAHLRALQHAVDQATLIKMAKRPEPKSKIQPIMRKALTKPPVASHVRLGHSLDQVQRSSWRLAPILGFLLAINVVEALIFDDIGSQTILGTSITLLALTLGLSLAFSVLAVGVWLVLHFHILSHVRLFHASRRHVLKLPLVVGLLQALGLRG